jgi:hypothetical protein
MSEVEHEFEVEITDPQVGVVGETEPEAIKTNSQNIGDFLDAIKDQNFTQAERQFNDLIGDRLQDTLDATKARIAASIYDEAPTEEEAEEMVDDLEDDEEEV